MTRRFYVLRHARADSTPAGGSDADRELTDAGRKDAKNLGRWLARHGTVPGRIVASSAVRARQTAEAVAEEAGIGPDAVVLDRRVYDADATALLTVTAERDAGGHWMLVGHNPGCEALVEALCGRVEPGPDGKVMPSGTVAVLRVPEEGIRPGACTLERIMRPSDLR